MGSIQQQKMVRSFMSGIQPDFILLTRSFPAASEAPAPTKEKAPAGDAEAEAGAFCCSLTAYKHD